MASVSCRSAKRWLLLDAKIFSLEATRPRSHPGPTVFDSSSAMDNSMHTELLHAAEMRTLAMIADGAGLKKRVIVADVASEPNWHDEYRDLAIRNGIRAGWSQPILTKDQQVLGTFALYSSESRVPTDVD